MVEPTYFIENRYSFVVDALAILQNPDFEVAGPEEGFERTVQTELALANRLLVEGKHSAALEKYLHLRRTISVLLWPKLFPWDKFRIPWAELDRVALLPALVGRSVEMLKQTPITASAIPAQLLGGSIDDAASQQFGKLELVGLRDNNLTIGPLLDRAQAAVEARDFKVAVQVFQQAAEQADDESLKAAILHDLAITQERSGSRQEAIDKLKASAESFANIGDVTAQVAVLASLAGTHARGGDDAAATAVTKQIDTLKTRNNLFDITVADPARSGLVGAALADGVIRSPGGLTRGSGDVLVRHGRPLGPATSLPLRVNRDGAGTGEGDVTLISATAFAQRQTQKRLGIIGSLGDPHQIVLDAHAHANLNAFYDKLSETRDLGLLTDYLTAHTTTVAYLPHVYFWIVPMAIGDCHAALGSYAEAEKEYLSTVDYQYINKLVETVNLWLRLAELYLDWGDRLYRQAGNVQADFGAARAMYERVLRLDNTLDDASPLYASDAFASLKDRVVAAIQGMFVAETPVADNPRLLGALARARMQLSKIDAGLNFLGISLTLPPYSFEHLQTVARYFAQHASQVEGMYLQFQSSGESEQLREQQMSQQVTLAGASVELEERGVDEAREGVDVAGANLNAADVQAQNAQQAANDFANVRSELLELDTLQAWSGAAAMDQDEEVQQTITGYTYYNASKKRRSQVLKDLARRRTKISHRLEAARLQREIAAAQAYRQVAQQQVQQAQARVDVARQRVVVAQLQQQFAQENLDFLQSRELGSVMWYNLAREARRLAMRYLDMAIEVATMLEKAYEAETGRDLRKIKTEYGLAHLHGLLGAEALLVDIDFFALDQVRTRAKKAQLRQSLSIADLFPMALQELLTAGRAHFETTLEHFDRRYPGFYLQKIKQVEVVFVGLNGSEGVHGTLRNIGVSQFRQKNGDVVSLSYPADVMPLSEYSIRQDALVFQLDAKELRLFENNGVATMWQLELPLSTNTFDLGQILDVQLVVYFDGFFDENLETSVRQTLPTSDSGARAVSMAMFAPDELYFLRSHGSGGLRVDSRMLPVNHVDPVLTSYALQVVGPAAANLKVRLDSANLGTGHLFTLDADGNADGTDFAAPVGQTPVDSWTVSISPDDNPGVDLNGVSDVALYFEYDFDYRS